MLISIFAMMAGVGASISAMINAHTARSNFNEVSENNRRLLRPFMIVKPKEINIDFDYKMAPHVLNWDTGTYDLGGTSNSSYIVIKNLSNGIAKNVNVTVNMLNYNSVFRNIVDPGTYVFIEGDIDDYHDQTGKKGLYINYNYRSNGKEYAGSNLFALEEFPIEEFLAIERGDDIKVKIPHAFIALYNTYFQLTGKLHLDLEQLPHLNIKIELEDVLSNKYINNYVIKPKSINVIRALNYDLNVNCYFEVKEYYFPTTE